ncbi:MAG TPA: carbon-nitrogen hydrolase family protein [Amaricoccus sp.]|uniref:carbon-nitrogen hydrolase family protein n=1 Tax=Amaricoccus sp. TaxID=1872485 RepID=UPI002D05107E|nr:carbon-nitrogen hydrolase family protein [Amaricoccus sp.]HMQ93046.1 carbon-nitrogen hydrolase family protein [Amaricoccus sp.]HMR53334.1 carbon-nitrogen hydrolase family protein [Amaricoccus sp.]HMR59466.1 carbon-nitrogen hydrolase family protein [Amaricoccus sp.]HMT98967.1 carbon-nitrogen hydrolase family protein [Amaricoccus sp.]
MRIAVDQWRPVAGGSPAGLARLNAAAGRAAAGGADLLMVPEMALTGYNIGAEAVRAAADPENGPVTAAVGAIARRHGLAVLAGFPRLSGGRVLNTVNLMDRNGTLRASYAKTHLYGAVDRKQFTAGPEIVAPVELGGWKLGLAICYDIEFPEVARALALAGAEAILAPTANMAPYETVATRLVPARAEENTVFLAYANYSGREGEFEYFGLSCVCGPDGNDVARAGQGEEMVFADLDREALAKTRRLATHLADRRPDLYGSLTTGGEKR